MYNLEIIEPCSDLSVLGGFRNQNNPNPQSKIFHPTTEKFQFPHFERKYDNALKRHTVYAAFLLDQN